MEALCLSVCAAQQNVIYGYDFAFDVSDVLRVAKKVPHCAAPRLAHHAMNCDWVTEVELHIKLTDAGGAKAKYIEASDADEAEQYAVYNGHDAQRGGR